MSPKGMTSPHRARKRFGQNFLVDETIIGQIIAAIGARADHHLIEIGPGTAALTQHLLEQKRSRQPPPYSPPTNVCNNWVYVL